MLKPLLFSTITAVLTAVAIDLTAYVSAKMARPTKVTFAWHLFLIRIGIGCVTGVLGGLAGKVQLAT